LHAISHFKQNIDWYIINGIVSIEAASELDTLFSHAVKEIVPHMNTIVDSLGLPKTLHLYGPIARNYVAFNSQTDNENFEAAGELFDFRTTGAKL